MKKLIDTVGCILDSTRLLVIPASGEFATLTIDEVYRNRPSASDAQVDAAGRLTTHASHADSAASVDQLDYGSPGVVHVSCITRCGVDAA